ncbi:MAG: peptidoglycan-binding protein, partial [Clostridia bacterium]|nr:peptidoglycan-binding protein [Clostridia bacterium]
MAKKISLLLAVWVICLMACAAFAEEGLKPGDSGDAVLELNTRLRQLNYTTVRASDQYSAATETAVAAVQAAYGLEATGVADEATLNIIYGDCYRPLSYGAEGLDVKLLQERLVELGYYSGN